MPQDLRAILARVEEELGEDARETLEEALPMDGEGELPDDVLEAKDGEMKGAIQKMATGRYGPAIQSRHAPHRESTQSGPARNPVTNGTNQKMEPGGSDSEHVDYTEDIAAAFSTGN